MNNAKTKVALTIGLMIFLVISIVVIWNPLQVVEWKISDLFFKSQPVSDDITIIAIDDASLSPEAGLGRFKDWPRTYYADLLRKIAPSGPKVVAFDLDFRQASKGMSDGRVRQILRDYEIKSAQGTTSYPWYTLLKRFEVTATDVSAGELTHPDDVEFSSAMDEFVAGGGEIVLASSLVFDEGVAEYESELPPYTDIVAPIFGGASGGDDGDNANISSGYVNVLIDRDGTVRRFSPRVDSTTHAGDAENFARSTSSRTAERSADAENFAYTIARVANENFVADAGADAGAGVSAGVSAKNKSQLIAYSARPFSFRMISFVDVLAGKSKPEDFAGKIVLVGGTAPILQDFQNTPTSRNPMPGVEINANIVQQLLDGSGRSEQGAVMTLFWILILALGGAFLLLNMPLAMAGVIFALVVLVIPTMAFASYQMGSVMNVVYTELAWVTTGIAMLWYRNKTELRAKREIKMAFSHYVSPVVVDELTKDPSALKLGGKRENISIMFSDIVGFTSLAEKLTPEDTVALLNDYLTAMTEIVFSYNGTLDKYQGDAIMALFGAPMKDEHKAVNACSTALGMRRALVGLHEKWNTIPELPFKEELIKIDFRVGIASGPAIIGNVGSTKRFDYTAIGDMVNLGSRLESVNRMYGTQVIVDKGTFTEVTENHNPFIFRKLDTVRVKGKKTETEIFELVTLAETASDELKAMLDDFENGRLLYTQRNFIDAKQYFEAVLKRMPNDSPSKIYFNRCNFYLRKPPGREWNAVVNLDEK